MSGVRMSATIWCCPGRRPIVERCSDVRLARRIVRNTIKPVRKMSPASTPARGRKRAKRSDGTAATFSYSELTPARRPYAERDHLRARLEEGG